MIHKFKCMTRDYNIITERKNTLNYFEKSP